MESDHLKIIDPLLNQINNSGRPLVPRDPGLNWQQSQSLPADVNRYLTAPLPLCRRLGSPQADLGSLHHCLALSRDIRNFPASR